MAPAPAQPEQGIIGRAVRISKEAMGSSKKERPSKEYTPVTNMMLDTPATSVVMTGSRPPSGRGDRVMPNPVSYN